MGRMSPEAAERAVSSILQAQSHRGPDDRGIEVVRNTCAMVLVLGSCRLAIQDLSPLGHQPMRNHSSGDLLIYNGEVYNVRELRRELESAGYVFEGHSDTEVLLRSYEHWQGGCVRRLRGMFAFCIWDARRHRLLMARDHLGIKPLYYARLPGGGMVCASELRALLASGLIQPSLSREGLGTYLAFGSVQEPTCIWEGIRVLPRASVIEFDGTGEIVGQKRYWSPPFPLPREEFRVGEALEQGRALLERSVRTHFIGDVPAGLFLSSGLDSTAILSFASETRDRTQNLQGFTVTFPDNQHHDESAITRAVAQRFGVQHHECEVSEQTALRWIEDGLQCMDQPSIDGLNTYIIARAVHDRGIIVALSGLGGDELLAGYSSFRRAQRFAKVLSLSRAVPAQVRQWASSVLTLFANSVVQEKVRDLSFTNGLKGIYLQLRRLMSDETLRELGFCDLPSMLDENPNWSVELDESLVPSDPLATVARLESIFYMGNMLLRDTDVFSMANSLEVRVPFLDREVAEWAYSLPGSVLLPRGARPKHLLRELCPGAFLPAQLQQQKRGFSLPFSSWLQGPLRDLMHDSLDYLSETGTVEAKGIRKVYRLFGEEPFSAMWSRLWALVALGYWLRRDRVFRRQPAVATIGR